MYAGPGELVNLVAEVNRPNLGVLLDLGHLNVTSGTLGFDRNTLIDEVAPHLLGFHLSDNDRLADRNWPVGADSWIVRCLHRRECRDTPKILESTFRDPDDARRQRDSLIKAIGRV